MTITTRRGRHQAGYTPPAVTQERGEEEAPTLVGASMADRDHDVKAIIAAELTALAQFLPF